MAHSPCSEYEFLAQRFDYFFEKFPWVSDYDVSKFPESKITKSTMYNIRKRVCKKITRQVYKNCVDFLSLYDKASESKIHDITSGIRAEVNTEKEGKGRWKSKDFVINQPVRQHDRFEEMFEEIVYLRKEIKLLHQEVVSFRVQMNLSKYKPYVDVVKAQEVRAKNITPPFTPTTPQHEEQQPTVIRKRGWFSR